MSLIPIPSLLAVKLGARALCAVALIIVGFYAGYRWELPAVQKAQLALAAQVTADSVATAQADRQAAADLIADTNQNNAALAAHQGRVNAAQGTLGTTLTQIPTQAAQAGQDGPLAPVLVNALAAIAAEEGGKQ